jgi:hypothetical protein
MKNDNAKGLAYYQNMRTKYINYAQEALLAGDRILCEYNLQFVEHYNRIIAAKHNQSQKVLQKQEMASEPLPNNQVPTAISEERKLPRLEDSEKQKRPIRKRKVPIPQEVDENKDL